MSTDLPPPLPDPQRLGQALALLEPHGGHPATGALHDPLYLMLREQDAGQVGALRAALRQHRDHPAAEALRELLAGPLDLPSPSLEDVLRDHGPWAGGDPVAEVDRRLRKARRDRQVLEERLQGADRDLARLSASNQVFAFVAALLAALAVAGWLGALGAWRIDWVEPPEPPTDPSDARAGDQDPR